MSQQLSTTIAVIGVDIGKNSFHIVGLDQRGAIVLRQKWSRGQVESRFANMPPCLIGMEACVGAHHLSRQLKGLGHDARLMPAKYVRPYSKGQKNDFRGQVAARASPTKPHGNACAGHGSVRKRCVRVVRSAGSHPDSVARRVSAARTMARRELDREGPVRQSRRDL